ncbi:MAG: hypothetical protein ACK5XU_17675 [Pseudomonadota bacterium]
MSARTMGRPPDMYMARLVLDRLRRRGFSVFLRRGRVRVSPARRLPPDLRADVVAHRAGLLALLDAPADHAPLPPPHPASDRATGGRVGPASDAAAPAGCGARQRELAARLLRWGWSAAVAEATAARIVARNHSDGLVGARESGALQARPGQASAQGVGRFARVLPRPHERTGDSNPDVCLFKGRKVLSMLGYRYMPVDR